jgi:hypothetical protein
MPVDEVTDGMLGTGYTVSEGRDPEPFDVEVLGVMENGIGPGRDLIIVETDSPAIDSVGGIWFGMSGSPVYAEDGSLIGAIAYGMSFGPSPIAGITPAEDMVKVLDYPATGGTATQSVELSPRMAAKASAESGESKAHSSEMEALLTPLSVSGTSKRALKRLKNAAKREDLPILPYAGSSSSATTFGGPADPPIPGSSFAGALSYGDVTMAGIGTTTYVCDGWALAFGHPFLGPIGQMYAGANAADALAIIDDEFGPYKLATVEETFGIVDQDRFAAIRADLGEGPTTAPVTSSVTTPNLSREGQTDVATPDFFPLVALTHMLGNFDMSLDRIGEGSSTLDWTINGTREEGGPWEISRNDLYSSEFDISIESLEGMQRDIERLASNRFEEIEFTGVDLNADFESDPEQYKIEQVMFSKNGEPFVKARKFRARRGGTINVRATLSELGSDATQDVFLKLTAPGNVRSELFIELGDPGEGGGGGFGFFSSAASCSGDCGGSARKKGKISSFDDLLEDIEGQPQNNELKATLYGPTGRERDTDTETLTKVVKGFRFFFIRMQGGNGGGGGGEPEPASTSKG